MAENRNLLTPANSVTGKNTTAVVSVDARSRQSHFLSTSFGRDLRRLSHFKVTIDIFESYDDRIIDQPRQRQRQPTQHHAVDGRSAQL